jgi:hypothetical protein
MSRFILTALAVGFLFSAAVAATPSPQVQSEYANRLLTMQDTAAAHVALAQWCAASGLDGRARVHWQEAIARDADNKEARAALGYVRHNMEWVQGSDLPAGAAEASPAVAPKAPQDPTFGQRQRAIGHDVQDALVNYLSSMNEPTRQEGHLRILMIRDPAGAEPIARILGIGSVETRKIACEALGQITGEEASKLLVKFLLSDESEDVAQAAAAALKDRQDRGAIQMLLNALNGSEKPTARAAYALGEIGDLATAPALISHLKKPETKVLKAPAPANSGTGNIGSYFMSGTIVTYIANQTPVVATGAVGWSPTIGAIPVGSMIAAENPRVMIYRTIIEMVPQPAVHDALQKMTGQDFDYNSAEWRTWLDKQEREKARPPQ